MTNEAEFKLEMKVRKGMNGAAHSHLLGNWDCRHWSLAYASDLNKCDVIDNNMYDTFNEVILEARTRPIISILEKIRLYVMRRLVRSRKLAYSWKGNFGPKIIAKLDKNRAKVAGKWEVDWNGGNEHGVFYENSKTITRESFAVSLRNRTCNCRGWDVSEISCQRAIVAISYEAKDSIGFIDPCFNKFEYLKSYGAFMHQLKYLCSGLSETWKKSSPSWSTNIKAEDKLKGEEML